MIVKNFLINQFLFLIFLSCISCGDSQKENDKKIDSLLHKARVGTENLQYSETVKYAKEAEAYSLKSKNTKKLPFVYIELADGLAGLELQKESISYLEKIMKMNFAKKDKIFQARVYQIYAYNYLELGMGTQAVYYSKKAISTIEPASIPEELEYISRSYGDITLHHYSQENTDSASYYFNKWEKVLNKRLEKDAVFDLASFYNLKGFLAVEQKKQIDSGLFNFRKGYDLKIKYKDPVLDSEYLGFGYSYFVAGDFTKALEYLLKAEQNVKENNIKTNDINGINELLMSTYEALGDTDKQTYYFKKYKNYNDSVQVARKKNINIAIDILMSKKTEETSSVRDNYTLLLAVILAIILFAGLILYRYFSKKKKTAIETEELLQETENLLSQKEIETLELKQKVNTSFDEIVLLAKENNPEFLTRFREVYPQFAEKLKMIYPDITNDDLRFCAFLKLNFSTKDISDFTFVTVRSVQTRKSRLRKKFSIPSEMDIYLWISGFEG